MLTDSAWAWLGQPNWNDFAVHASHCPPVPEGSAGRVLLPEPVEHRRASPIVQVLFKPPTVFCPLTFKVKVQRSILCPWRWKMKEGTPCLLPEQWLVPACDHQGVTRFWFSPGSTTSLPLPWLLVSIPVTKMDIYSVSIRAKEGERTLSEPLICVRPCVIYHALVITDSHLDPGELGSNPQK